MPYVRPQPGDPANDGSSTDATRIIDALSDGLEAAEASLTSQASQIAAKAADTAVVHNTGDETVAGVKTFTSSPIVPAPSGSTAAANKAYVDATAAAGVSYGTSASTQAVGDAQSPGVASTASRSDHKHAMPAFGTTAGSIAEGNDTRITGAAQKSANLSDLANTATARSNLGLGGSATLNVGTTAGTVAAGDDSRFSSPTIADGSVTNAKLANAAPATIKGRASGAGTGAPTDLTPAQARTVLGVVSSSWLNAKDYGAVGDATRILGGISAASSTFTATTSVFTSGDVGKSIIVTGAGASGADLVTTIAGFTSATVVTLTASAGTTVASAETTYGTNDTSALASWAAAVSATASTAYLPAGTYISTATITFTKGVRLVGDGMGWFNTITPSIHAWGSRIIFTATTGDGIVFDGNAGTESSSTTSVSVEEIAVVQAGALTCKHTSGNGIRVRDGWSAAIDRVLVLGFATSFSMNKGSWTMQRCLAAQHRTKGLYIENTYNVDMGDMGVLNNVFLAPIDAGRTPTAIDWASGAGPRIIGNKIVSGTSTYAYGIDFLSPDPVGSVLIISGNSIEGISTTPIRVRTTGGTNKYRQVIIADNEFGANGASITNIVLSAGTAGYLSDVIITGNSFQQDSGSNYAVSATNVDNLTLGPNNYRGFGTNYLSETTCTNTRNMEVASTPTFTGVRVLKTSTQGLTTNSDNSITWDSEGSITGVPNGFDTSTMHSTSTNTERLIAPSAGYYVATANVRLTTSGSTVTSAVMQIKTSRTNETVAATQSCNPDTFNQIIGSVASGPIYLAANDYVFVNVYPVASSGTCTFDNTNSGFSLMKVG